MTYLRKNNKSKNKKSGRKTLSSDLVSGTYWHELKKNAIRRNLDFNIDMKYAQKLFEKQKRKCAISGIELKFMSSSKNYDGNASLDRINSKLGYVKGNVQWLHKDINIMKWHHEQGYFIELCKIISEFNK